MNGWMGGWMDGWMDGWVDGWIDRSLYLYTVNSSQSYTRKISTNGKIKTI